MGQSSARLILICGLPGSGKTTLARQLVGEINAFCLSGDEWMAHASDFEVETLGEPSRCAAGCFGGDLAA